MPSTMKPHEAFCSLNGIKFALVGPVQNFIASQFPPKIVQGDFGLDTHPFISTVEWRDWRGGLGKDTYDEQDRHRAWWATTTLRHRGHNVLQRRSVQTAAASSSGVVGFIGDISTSVLASFGTAVHAYNNSTDSWGSSVRTLASAATDSLTEVVNGTYTLVVAQGTDVDWTTDGSSWNRNTTNITYLAFWRDVLWGIDATTGKLYFTSNLANGFTEDATLNLQADSVTKLFVGPSAEGDALGVLYAATTRGLYVFDVGNSRFIDLGFRVPFHPNNGSGARAWRSNIYYPAGHAIYEHNPVTGITRVVGPDLDDGLPSDRRGSITATVATHNEFVVGINSATGSSAAIDTFLGTEPVTQLHVFFERDAGLPTLLGWAGGNPPIGQGGWEVKWGSGTSGDAIDALHTSNQYASYRLWWGSGGRVYYQTLPTDIVNPSQVSTTEYEAAGTLETPWLTISGNQVGLALKTFLETRNPTSSETVTVAYARNFVESFTTLGTNSSAGEQAYQFNDASSNATGLEFRSIRFRLTSARGTTVTRSPDVVKLAFAYRRSFSFLKGFRVQLDLTRPFEGRGIRELRDQLDAILDLKTQMEFFYRDATETEDVFYVTVVPSEFQGLDREAGRNERGTHVLTLVEAI